MAVQSRLVPSVGRAQRRPVTRYPQLPTVDFGRRLSLSVSGALILSVVMALESSDAMVVNAGELRRGDVVNSCDFLTPLLMQAVVPMIGEVDSRHS